MKIKPPENISVYALDCLEALKESGLGGHIVLGGAFGLFHYHAYRTTKDVDAWWTEDATEKNQQEIVRVLENRLSAHGSVQTRRFGDVVSVDLSDGSRPIFSFQIARRSARIGQTEESPWPPVRLDSLKDLVASKMSALVQRGVPRDFLDIYTICQQRLASVETCWQYFEERERKRGVTRTDRLQACEAVLLHLSRIERMRPLDKIADEQEKENAFRVRNWFKKRFCEEPREPD